MLLNTQQKQLLTMVQKIDFFNVNPEDTVVLTVSEDVSTVTTEEMTNLVALFQTAFPNNPVLCKRAATEISIDPAG